MNRPMNADMNPFSQMLGWLGGRSFAEMRQHGGEGCANAFTIGTFLLIGMAANGLGQYLFIQSLPGYAGGNGHTGRGRRHQTLARQIRQRAGPGPVAHR